MTDEQPSDFEAEQAILGAIIYDNKHFAVVSSIVKSPDYFHFKEHQYIFRAAIDLHQNNIAIDEVLLGGELKKSNQLEAVGDYGYLGNLSELVPAASNVAYYAKLVAEKYHLRKVIAITALISEKSKIRGSKSSIVIDEAIEELLELRSSLSNSARAVSVFDCMPEIISNIELTRDKKIEPGLITGYSEFDRMLGGGAQKGDLIFIGAEPSVGKTSLGVCLSYAMVFSSLKGIIFSIESSRESIIRDRLLPAAMEINSHKLRYGNFSKEKWDLLYQQASNEFLKDLKICDDSSININDIYSIISMEQKTNGVDFVLIDYTQLISPVRNSGNRNNDLGDTAKGLKRINKDFNIPVIALSQLNEKGKLRDSGELNQIADVEIILTKNEDMEGIINCDFRKNRNGIKGIIPLKFIPEFTKFLPAK